MRGTSLRGTTSPLYGTNSTHFVYIFIYGLVCTNTFVFLIHCLILIGSAAFSELTAGSYHSIVAELETSCVLIQCCMTGKIRTMRSTFRRKWFFPNLIRVACIPDSFPRSDLTHWRKLFNMLERSVSSSLLPRKITFQTSNQFSRLELRSANAFH